MSGLGSELLGGRYRLVEQVGAGGMSVVWRGYDEVLGRQVAIKVLATRLAVQRSFRHRIRAEAKAAARLVHPHITNVYDYGESTDGTVPIPYVVMELVDGQPLAARLARHGTLPWRQAVAVCAEVASALAAAHARGIVHRDVTPGNVMLTPTGAKVVDFGISALVGENDIDSDGTLLGTPAYLAPERLDAGQVSAATDVYALGLLLYRSLVGRLPWSAATTTQMLRNHRHTEPGPLPPVEGLPDEVAQLCLRCLAKSPADRPDSAEVARTLAAAVGLPGIVPVPPVPTGTAYDHGAGALATAGTTILPGSTMTGPLPTGGARGGQVANWWSGRSPVARRRLAMVAAGVGLVLFGGTAWSAAAGSPATGRGEPANLALGAQPEAPCLVEYAVDADSGRAFDAVVTLTNGDGARQGWMLAFTLPGDQTLVRGEPVAWQQTGQDVVLRPSAGAPPLAPGAKATIRLAGTYATANALPVLFQFDGQSCQARVTGLAGTEPDSGGTAAGGAAGASPDGAAPPSAVTTGPGSGGPGEKSRPGEKGGPGDKKGKQKPPKPDDDDDDDDDD